MEQVFDVSYLQEKFDSKEYGIVELLILKALYKYIFLEKGTLAAAVNLNLKPQLQKPNYETNIKKLLGKAIVKGRCIAKTQAAYANREVVYYYLTVPALEFIKSGYRYLPSNLRNKEDLRDIATLYTDGEKRALLALNKWHTGVLEEYGEKVLQEKYYLRTFLLNKKVRLPSLIQLRYDKKETSNIIAFAYPREFENDKNEAHLVEIFSQIKDLDQALKHGKWKNQILVMICESTAQIEAAYRKMSEIGMAEDLSIIYALDADVATGSVLKRLYTCRLESDKLEKSYVSYKG